MYDQQAFDKLKNFFESHSASLAAAKLLKPNVDVGVVINQHNECAFFKDTAGKPHFERRRAEDPDVIFYLTPEAVESLVHGPHGTISEVAVNVTKNYLAGTIKVKIAGPLPNLIIRGYMDILRAGAQGLFSKLK